MYRSHLRLRLHSLPLTAAIVDNSTQSERLLVMFTAYVDDSGTDPNQKVAIATGLIVPANRIIAFQSEWNTFAQKNGFSDFHSAECAVANPKSDFAGWEDQQISGAFRRIRQITKKYGVKCYSLAVNKSDYDASVPPELRPVFGNYHYTWAMHSLLALLDEWACQSGVEHSLEFVLDWLDSKSQLLQKREIENAFARSEEERSGRFVDHYSFRHRKDYPGLQCADLLGWTCYRYALEIFAKIPLTELQRDCWQDFSNYRSDDEWLVAIGQARRQLQETVDLQMQRGLTLSHIRPHILPTKISDLE